VRPISGARDPRPSGGGPASGFLRLAFLVAQRDYLRTIRRRGYIFGTLLLPLGLGAVLVVSSLVSISGTGGVDPTTVRLVVVNESAVRLVNDPLVVPRLEVVERDEALERMRRGELAEAYVVPASFPGERTVTRLGTPSAERSLESLARHSAQESLLQALLRHAALVGAGVRPDEAFRLLRPVEVVGVTTAGDSVSEVGMAASLLVPLVFTLLFVMSIFITSGYLLQSVTEEKENRVIEIVLSSVPPLPFMAGKILGLGAAGLTQVAIWLATGLLALPLVTARVGSLWEVGISPLVMVLAVLYFLLGYLAFGAIFAAIGALAPGNREAQQYSSFFGFFAVIPLVFSAALTSDAGSMTAWALALFPLTAPATMLQVLALTDTPPWPMVVASLGSLALFVALATLVCARVFRATLLLYGVRPGLRQLLRTVAGGS
jgi:ABC-2 type transport system permease protein